MIRILDEADLTQLIHAFCFPWSSHQATADKWNQYYAEQQKQIRSVYLLEYDGSIIGYGSFLRDSNYPDFRAAEIPEIHDIWVSSDYRKQGFGRQLVLYMEEVARAEGYEKIGLGVGLYSDYGPAQQLYVKLGYQPDGKGVSYQYEPIVPGESHPIDDDLNLWLTKDLSV